MVDFLDSFAQPIAYNPDTEKLVADAEFTVHLPDDLSFANPLTVRDPVSDVPISPLRANAVGVLPDFRVPGDPPQVLLKSGSFVTKVTSVFGAVLAAGLAPAVVAEAIAARAAAQSSADAAATSANSAAGYATAAEAASARAAASGLGQFEIQPLVLIGHSWQASTQNTSAGGRWWERLAKRLGMGAATVKAVSGRTIGDNAVLSLSGANAWSPRTRALVTGGCTINDLVRFSGSASGRRAYIHAWRAMLSVLTANAAVAANTRSFVFSNGGWERVNVTGSASDTSGLVRNSTGGQQWHTETVNDYFEFTFTGTDVDVHMVAKIAGAGLITFTEGATVLGTLDLTPTVAQEVPAIFRIRGLTAGTHTIRGKLTSGASMWVDSYRIPSTAPAPIMIYGEPPLIWTNYGDQATLEALLTSFKGELAQICGEYPSVLYVDFDRPSWDPATMLTADGIHPNDKGAAWLATEGIQDLAAVPYSLGLNVTASAYPAIYTAPAGPAIPSGGKAGDFVAGVTLPVTDTFNRSDSTGTLGTTSDGTQLWGELGSPGITGAAGISSNRGYCSARSGSSGWYVRTLETGLTDHKVTGKLGAAPSIKHGLMFAIVDGSNLMYVYPESSSALTIGKRIANVAATIQSGVTATITATSEITASIVGTAVTIKVDGATVWTGTVSDRPAGTKIGFGIASSSGSFDGYWDQLVGDLAA